MAFPSAERQIINVIPPTGSNTAGVGVTILAATTTAAAAAVPEALFNRYVYLAAEGDKIWVTFGPAASPDVDKTNAGGATFAAGTVNDNGITLPDGAKIAVRLSKGQHDYIKWQANAANSKLIVWPTTPARAL
jgi:hypothetical protein